MKFITRRTSTITLAMALQVLHLERSYRYPALFILEVAAALLSVLALRDEISGSPAVTLETMLAVGLWGVVLAVVLCLTLRTLGGPMGSRTGVAE